ncbi:MAG: polysaccharide biosynthesis tyrosine autokinase [Oscillospiraceae bacterium]|nr:polysaccharide biosynthesis tyrosine autokinase [Oscillospiraceae bacterium]
MKQSVKKQSVWAEIEPYCVLHRILKNWWMVFMCAALFSLSAFIGTTLFVHPVYSCSATLAVNPRNNSSALQSSTITSSSSEQFASFLSSNMLVNRVRRIYGSDVKDATVSTTFLKGTNMIQLRVNGPSPRSAYYMCAGILEHYEEYSQIVFNSLILETVSAPTVPEKGSLSSMQRKAILIGAPLGALAMIALLTLLCIISGTVQTLTGARNQIDSSLLVTLNHQRKQRTLRSRLSRKKSSLLISNPTTSFLYVESIHQLRTKAEHEQRHHKSKAFLVASVGENEGKSTVAANLALSLARRSSKVLLVDCDLRKAAQHLIFEANLDKAYTLTSLLTGSLDLENIDEAVQYRKAENLYVLFASNVRRHSADLLVSERMQEVLALLRERFDYIILDSSPMAFFTDTKILCDLADASMLVVRQDMMPDRAVNDAIDSLSHCKARFLGYIFNDVHSLNLAAHILGGHRSGYGYGYGYGRGYGYGYGGYKGNYYNYGYGSSSSRTQSSNSSQETVSLSTTRKKRKQNGDA